MENDRMPFFLTANMGEVIKGIKQEDCNIEKERKSIKNIEKIKSDRSKWRYSLNLRGFLLYLNCANYKNNINKILNPKKYNKNKNIKNQSNPESDWDIVKIRQVLSNPTIKDKFIFLNSWEIFGENGFNVIETLLEIANELEEQLEKYDERILLTRVTEKYLSEIDNHFSKYGSFFHSNLSLNQETENILRQYRLSILEYLKKELVVYINELSE